jgi:hypothetical protein
MLLHCYLRNGVIYVPTVVRLTTGAYMNVEPIAVVPAASTEDLRRAFSDTITRGNKVVPNPPKDEWPPSVLAKYAGVKTWTAFARNTSGWNIEETEGRYQIVGYRNHPDGYWVPDSEKKIDFPPGSRAAVVIDRMIAILQDAARQQA